MQGKIKEQDSCQGVEAKKKEEETEGVRVGADGSWLL